jgi:hypothetical protein
MTAEHVYRRGDRIVWYESRPWGGKQSNPAEFVEYRGERSARIKVNGADCERTVRLDWITPSDRKRGLDHDH